MRTIARQRLSQKTYAAVIGIFVMASFGVHAAWEAPTGAPRTANTSSLIDVSSTAQTKIGPLTIQRTLTVTDRIKGTAAQLKFSGADAQYALELGKIGGATAPAAGIRVTTPALHFQSVNGSFFWLKQDPPTVAPEKVLELTNTRALILRSDVDLVRHGADRVRFTPGNPLDPNATPLVYPSVELGKIGPATAPVAGIRVTTPALHFQSSGGYFYWLKQDSSTTAPVRHMEVDANKNLRVQELCLNEGTAALPNYVCRSDWPASVTSTVQREERDTLMSVTNPGRGDGHNRTRGALTVQGLLTVRDGVTAQRFNVVRDTRGVAIVTTADLYVSQTQQGTINADTVDGMHADDLIQAAAAAAVQARPGGAPSGQCGVTKLTLPVIAKQVRILCKNASAVAGTATALETSPPNASVTATPIQTPQGMTIGDGSTQFFLVGGGCDVPTQSALNIIGSYPITDQATGIPGWACQLNQPQGFQIHAVCCTVQ